MPGGEGGGKSIDCVCAHGMGHIQGRKFWSQVLQRVEFGGEINFSR